MCKWNVGVVCKSSGNNSKKGPFKVLSKTIKKVGMGFFSDFNIQVLTIRYEQVKELYATGAVIYEIYV